MANKELGLRLFVAMPYSDFGPEAPWKKPDDVKGFYKNVADALSERIHSSVELIIEEDRDESGVIHESMFREIQRADFFIADITGANANVLFELGVRFGVRRSVTVLTSQDKDILFNINNLRVVRYADRREQHSGVPPLKLSACKVQMNRNSGGSENGKQTSEARRDCLETAPG